MSKIDQRPKNFSCDGLRWTIKYIPEKGDLLGETQLNCNMIHLWVKGIPEDCIRETLQHELLHVVLRDCMQILSNSQATPHDIEEAVVRMASPRLFALLAHNKNLREYIYGK